MLLCLLQALSRLGVGVIALDGSDQCAHNSSIIGRGRTGVVRVLGLGTPSICSPPPDSKTINLDRANTSSASTLKVVAGTHTTRAA